MDTEKARIKYEFNAFWAPLPSTREGIIALEADQTNKIDLAKEYNIRSCIFYQGDLYMAVRDKAVIGSTGTEIEINLKSLNWISDFAVGVLIYDVTSLPGDVRLIAVRVMINGKV